MATSVWQSFTLQELLHLHVFKLILPDGTEPDHSALTSSLSSARHFHLQSRCLQDVFWQSCVKLFGCVWSAQPCCKHWDHISSILMFDLNVNWSSWPVFIFCTLHCCYMIRLDNQIADFRNRYDRYQWRHGGIRQQLQVVNTDAVLKKKHQSSSTFISWGVCSDGERL